MNKNTDLILLYDGICGFCNSTVQLIIRHDTKKTIRFAAIQSQFAAELFERYPYLEEIDSLILIEAFDTLQERILVRSAGALTVARYLGGWWSVFLIGYIIPFSVRDWFYDIFAKYRYRFFGKYDSCRVPPLEIRQRFIDHS